ncbi:hypothetical protein C8R44DRAFT_665179 [Mycena epipterygia]|nr:hypothetical protein C8R44DRAFT_665179 [Mycena epipterygia]
MLPANTLIVAAPQAAGADIAQQPKLPTASSSFSPRLAHLLNSNDAPLDSDIPSIRQIISHNQARVDALDVQIDVLRTAMEQLIAERDERQERVLKYTAVMSPVRRVPPELIHEIFALTLPHTRRIGEISIKFPPWRLGHICRSWRDWVLADPLLWCSVEISKFPDIPLLDIYPLSMLKRQLLRSGTAPLAVNFDSRDSEDVLERPLWNLLIRHCDHWDIVRLGHSFDFDALSDLLDAVRGRVHQLKKLELVANTNRNPLNQPNYFSIAPNLREILLTDPNYTTNSPPLCVPWGQITHYRGVYPAERQLEILEAACNLVVCGVGFTGNMPDGGIVTLSHLRQLYVKEGNFLACLTAPTLEVLYLSGPVNPLLDFVNRSSCRLTRLVLEHCLYPDLNTLIEILRSLPFLKFLLVDTSHSDPAPVTSSFFNALTVSGASSDLCPNLTFLGYGTRCDTPVDPFSPDDLPAVVEMAQSRLHPGFPCRLSALRFFGVSLSSNFWWCIQEGIEILTPQGLDVAFLWGHAATTLIMKDRP